MANVCKIFFLFLLTSCSLIRVDNCDKVEDYAEVKAVDWDSCKKTCDDKGLYAYGGLIDSSREGHGQEYKCACGDPKEK